MAASAAPFICTQSDRHTAAAASLQARVRAAIVSS